MKLPLLTRAQENDGLVHLVVDPDIVKNHADSHCGVNSAGRLPSAPGPGEQYRFHFDMTRCIGCKCCVVACNEQNGNPADILWRRVGEIEGGSYPHTKRHYLSMGCNHCLEPTCMTGCPVDAYSKDSITGIVRHSADACIGCQYCTWNCSYGVPQYNPERGVVGKCDMCYGRLALGQSPACSDACPEEAIRIELVNVEEWRSQYQAAANSPGMPSADESISTTRITTPTNLPSNMGRVDLTDLHPEQPHWPLVVMTVLTQFSVGAFTSIWVLQVFRAQAHRSAALLALLVAVLALSASTLHLGRPIHAIRALKMWRRSWLSREVLLFTLFAVAATTYSTGLWLAFPSATSVGAATLILGICGVGASARLYLTPGRPAWNSPFTIVGFCNTAALLGAACLDVLIRGGIHARFAIAITVSAMLMVESIRLVWLARAHTHERRGAWQLLSTQFSNHLALRFALPCAGLALMSVGQHAGVPWVILTLILAGEFAGRYLFFVTVVPSNMAREYLVQEAA